MNNIEQLLFAATSIPVCRMTKAPIEAPPPPEICTQLLTMLSTILAAFILVAITMVSAHRRIGHPARGACEKARPRANALLAHDPAAHRGDVGAGPDPRDRDRDLGIVLSLGGMPAGCRVGVLLLWSHLRDGWLW